MKVPAEQVRERIREERDYWKRVDERAREEGVVCFLQNAWSPLYAGREWPRESWLRALRDSRSGKRLRLLIQNPGWCHNTTPVVGSTPSSKPPADLKHVEFVLRDRKPEIVIACGKQAHEALRVVLRRLEWTEIGLIVVPHPAARVLTDKLYHEAAEELARQREGERRKIEFKQRRGSVEKVYR